VPETWRLTWVLAGVLLLRADLEKKTTAIVDHRLLQRAASLTLEAGRVLEVVPASDPSLERLAMEMWCPDEVTGPAASKDVGPAAVDLRSERAR
jgi:hypothetical protein